MPNLSHSAIAAALAALGSASFLGACTKQEASPEPARAKEVTTSQATATAAASTVPGAAPTALPDEKREAEGQADASAAARKAGPAASATGKMSCGAGACSGSAAGKKK